MGTGRGSIYFPISMDICQDAHLAWLHRLELTRSQSWACGKLTLLTKALLSFYDDSICLGRIFFSGNSASQQVAAMLAVQSEQV